MMLRAVLLAGLLGCGGTGQANDSLPSSCTPTGEDASQWTINTGPGSSHSKITQCDRVVGYAARVADGSTWYLERTFQPSDDLLSVAAVMESEGSGTRSIALVDKVENRTLLYKELHGPSSFLRVELPRDRQISARIGMSAVGSLSILYVRGINTSR